MDSAMWRTTSSMAYALSICVYYLKREMLKVAYFERKTIFFS